MHRFFLRESRGGMKKRGGTVKEMSDSKLLTPIQVANLLGIRPKAVHRLVREKELSCIQVTNKKRRFLREQVNAFIKSRINQGPMQVDKIPSGSLPCNPKGGDRRKSVEDVGTDLGKEIRELCR
jgi:excisionase family DNA binding protein